MSAADSGDSAQSGARYLAAESRLYPIALADPELFERALSLVGRVAVEFRDCPDQEAIGPRCAEVLGRLPAIVATTGVAVTGLPHETLVEAAAALRWRELETERVERAVHERIEAARARGEEWLVEEPSPAMMIAGSVRRVELHLPTGASVVTTVEMGSDGQAEEYGLELLPGRLGQGVSASAQTYRERAEWLAATEKVRAGLSGHS